MAHAVRIQIALQELLATLRAQCMLSGSVHTWKRASIVAFWMFLHLQKTLANGRHPEHGPLNGEGISWELRTTGGSVSVA